MTQEQLASTASGSSQRFWRSLDELQQTPEFEEFLHREFPVAASEYPQGFSRRRWMQLMGASLAMGGVAGCRYSEEAIAPFVIRPEGRIPGEAYLRATNYSWAGRIHHLLVSCVDGRPLKIEGNPDHPQTRGGTDPFVQASILDLYDPDRQASVMRLEDNKRVESDWDAFQGYVKSTTELMKQSAGGVAILMPPTESPSLARMIGKLRERVPGTQVCLYDPLDQGIQQQAAAVATGKSVKPRIHLDQADVVLCVEADLLGHHSGFVTHAHGFASRRDPSTGQMNRLYVVESGFSSTGMASDSRLALQPSQMVAFLAALESRLDAMLGGESHEHGDESIPYDKLSAAERLERFLDVVVHDLVDARGKSLVAVGSGLGVDAVVAGHRINSKLDNFGKTLTFVESLKDLGETIPLATLVQQVSAGKVGALLIFGGNPVFTAPSDLDVKGMISRVNHAIYLGLQDDETAVLCDWALPEAHPLEAWGDVFGDGGHYGVCQPHILPLFGGRTAAELLALWIGDDEVSGEKIARRTADAIAGSSLSDRQWRKLLHDGFDAALGVQPVEVRFAGPAGPLTDAQPQALAGGDGINKDAVEVVFVPADGILDGRFANNGWLQELPQTLTKLTWDNAAVMNPVTAAALGVKHGVKIALSLGDATIELPVFEIPGVALGVITVSYGYGRKRAGAVGGHEDLKVPAVGVDVSPLRRQGTMLLATGVQARPRPRSTYEMATTQNHWAIDSLGQQETIDRSYQLVREGSSELYKVLPDFSHYQGVHSPPLESLWNEPINQIEKARPELPQWGMAIDLSKCIGCNACVVACQSENNVPIVGREQVRMGREMHWLRVDRYFQGNEDFAEVVQEPLMCQHCETAPCEQVCPVAATVHTDDGINAMAYNRCIGTRYCANNCPYKVRRFNYFNWNEKIGVGYGIKAYESNIENANLKLQQLVLNPEVTVRGRGVMEKCTFCIQRVEGAKIKARTEGGRPIRDGDVQTACQTACPASAIVFGNIQDDSAEVSKWKKNPRNYAMLDQLNVHPRTTYLARVRNTHPRLMTAHQIEELKKLPEKAAHHHAHADHGKKHEEKHHDDDHAVDGKTPAAPAAH